MSTRALKIKRYAERLGLTVHSVTWTPIGGAMEMCGPEGGWVVETDFGVAVGYNVGEVMESLTYDAKEKRRMGSPPALPAVGS